jgi:hypothetical protein
MFMVLLLLEKIGEHRPVWALEDVCPSDRTFETGEVLLATPQLVCGRNLPADTGLLPSMSATFGLHEQTKSRTDDKPKN